MNGGPELCKGAALLWAYTASLHLTPTPVLCVGNIDLQEQFTGSQGCFATNVQFGAVLKADMGIQIPALTSGLALALLNRFPSKLV